MYSTYTFLFIHIPYCFIFFLTVLIACWSVYGLSSLSSVSFIKLTFDALGTKFEKRISLNDKGNVLIHITEELSRQDGAKNPSQLLAASRASSLAPKIRRMLMASDQGYWLPHLHLRKETSLFQTIKQKSPAPLTEPAHLAASMVRYIFLLW